MDAHTRDTLFGRLALRVGWVTIEQLNAATEEQGRRQYPPPLGEVFVELGFMSEEQVQKLVKRQQDILAEREEKERSRAAHAAANEAPAEDLAAERKAQASVDARLKAQLREQEQARRAAAEQARRDAEEQARMQEQLQLEIDAQLQAQVEAQLAAQLQPDLQSSDALDAQLATALPIQSEEGAPAESFPRFDLTPGDAPQPMAMAALWDAVPSPAVPATAATEGSRSAWLDGVLTTAAQTGASDVHLHAGSPIAMRMLGELCTMSADVLDPTTLEGELRSVLGSEERTALDELGQVDLAYTLPGVARFRGNIYRQQRGLDGAFRVIPPRAPTLAELGLPQQLARVTTYHQGIVLFTGPAGCGKSATMAAIVDLINAERTDHILTIEDPIEILHTPKRAIVNQRHAGHHTKSYARALRGALREDPDVIVIGEMRDYETISLALKAAETGHLVLATLHTNSAARTINRVVGAFPPNQQGQARSMLSESLRAVISQRLVVRADRAGRVPAIEVLYVNPAVGNLIRDNRTVQLRSVLQTQSAQGMCLLDASLADLIKRGVITWQDAAVHAEDPKKLPGAPAGGA